MSDTKFINLPVGEWINVVKQTGYRKVLISNGGSNRVRWIEASEDPSDDCINGHPLGPGESCRHEVSDSKDIYARAVTGNSALVVTGV